MRLSDSIEHFINPTGFFDGVFRILFAQFFEALRRKHLSLNFMRKRLRIQTVRIIR